MKISISTLFLTLFFSVTASAQIIGLGSAINKAGRQRMLTQRMTKDYLLIGAGIKVEAASKEIDESISIFEEEHNDLLRYAPNKEIKDALALVDDLWSKFRTKIGAVPDIDAATSIIMESTALMNACNTVVEKIQEYGDVKTAKLTNISGRQRMVSQRLAMFYVAYYWKVPYPNLIKVFDSTVNEYDDNLKFLMAESEKYPQIMETLHKTKSMWNFSKTGFDLKSNKLMPSVIYVTTNVMTNDFNQTTALYEKFTEK